MRGVPRRVFGYCRVSSDRQEREGTSLEGQRDEITRWCRSQGYPAPTLAVEVESGSAEKIEARQEQQNLTAEVGEGDIVVVVAVDRWSRDIVHAVSSVRDLVKRDVGWFAIRESIDASTPHGDSTLGIMAWTADQERRRIRERTVGRRRELANQGLYVSGTLPLGFKRDKKERKLVVVPEEAAIVRDIFARCIDGESLPEIAAAMPAVRKRREWTPHAVHRVLRSRYVLGEQRTGDGTWQEGAHPQIITYDTWERAHEAMRKRVHGGRKYDQGFSAQRLLRGHVVCATCGAKVSVRFGSPHQRAEPDGNRVQYYVCRGVLVKKDGRKRCDEVWYRARTIDDHVTEKVLARLVELRDELSKAPPAPRAPKTTDVAKALATIEARKRRTIDALTDGVLSSADAKDALARYEEQAAKVRRQAEREAADAERERRAADPKARKALAVNLGALRRGWAKLDVAERREVLALLANRAEVGGGGVRFSWRSVADLATGRAKLGIT